MKYVPSFLLLFVSIALFVASMFVGGIFLIPIGLLVLVVSERLFRRAHRS